MNWLVGAVPGLVAALAVVLMVRGYRLMTTQAELDLDDAEALYLLDADEQRRAPDGLLDRLAGRLVPHLRAVLPEPAVAWLQRTIDATGRPEGLDVDSVLAKMARWLIIMIPVMVLFAFQGRLVPLVLALTVPVILPLATLSGLANKRREQVDRDLPDFLDVLSVTVSAGLAFRSALTVVADRFGGPLAEEVRLVLQQVANGATMRGAFNGMRQRTGSEAVDEFVTAYLQAEELGAPLVDTLNQIAVDMRRASAQRLRQRAGRVEPRVSLVMTMVLIPGSLFLLVGGMIVALDVTSLGLPGG